MGRLIPAGTGMRNYQKVGIIIDPPQGMEIAGIDDVEEEDAGNEQFGDALASDPAAPGTDILRAKAGDEPTGIKI